MSFILQNLPSLLSAGVFYAFSAVLIASALMVVTSRNPVHSVLFLILCFFNAAALFLLMGAEFLAFTLIIVYVGAVAVLFLFVVMMLNITAREMRKGFMEYLPLGGLVGIVMLAQLIAATWAWKTSPAAAVFGSPENAADNATAIGHVLYTQYALPFQLCGLIMLVAMVGAIVLALRQRKDAKRQDVGAQLAIKTADVMEIRRPKIGEGVEI